MFFWFEAVFCLVETGLFLGLVCKRNSGAFGQRRFSRDESVRNRFGCSEQRDIWLSTNGMFDNQGIGMTTEIWKWHCLLLESLWYGRDGSNQSRI